MAINSGFFNSVNGDRKYDARWFADYFASFIGNGVFPNPSTGFQVIASGTDMTVTLKAGKAWINGYYVVNDSDFILTLDNADGVLNRIDRIVLRLDYLTREIVPVIKKGTFASSPKAQNLQRDADAYELGIADIYITKGSTAITQAVITDLRMNSNYCGIVAGVVEQIDVSSVFNQYQDWFDTYSVVKAGEFADWQELTKQAVDDWINSEQLDFENWRTDQEGVFADWYGQQQGLFGAWFNDIKDQLATVDIGEHLTSEMPHRFIDSTTSKLYKWGMGAENGIPYILIEEVM